jgi:hypothetical protein
LLRRFPTVRSPATSTPVLPRDVTKRYPALAEDIAVLDDVVGQAFTDSDREALRNQNSYRRQQVVLILGATLLSGLGGLQAALSDQRWPGILLAVLGLALAALGQTAGELNTFERFLSERVKTERFRAMYFRYLSRTGRYSGDDRTSVLRKAVVAVQAGEEPQ